jgi:RNA polymerase sigma factor (sigma-70 family)
MSTDPASIQTSLEHLFRHESGKMLSVLVRLFGLSQSEIAEDIVQETLLAALESWKLKGIPDQPRAWLYRTAKNKTIDFLRRERNFKVNVAPNFISTQIQQSSGDHWLDPLFLDTEIEDAQLRMMFACCHPAIPIESQLVLILKSLCGLSIREVATAFMMPDETVAKRLFRAREKIREDGLKLEPPSGQELSPRLDAVLQAIYLLFNEGYKSASSNAVIRRDLCEEALRLVDLLGKHPLGNTPNTHALHALMCFHTARFNARLSSEGAIVLLEKQDRSQWDQALIARGYNALKLSSTGNEISEYHIEAAIASYHASATSFDQTNWKAIYYCYELLFKINASPFIALNKAIVKGYAEGPQSGIDALLAIPGLDKNLHYCTALGDFYAQKKEIESSTTFYLRALACVALPAEKTMIQEKIARLKLL